MKIRNGFVSNSSSSSFVIAFPKKPETVEEIYNLLFGIGFELKELYGMSGVTIEDICKRILEDIEAGSASDKELLEQFKDNLYNRFRFEGTNYDVWDNNMIWRNYCGTNPSLYLDAYLARSAFDKIGDELEEKCEPYRMAHYERIRANPEQEEESYSRFEREIKDDKEISELKKKWTKTKRKYTMAINKCAATDLKFFEKDNFGAYILVKEYGNSNGRVEWVIEDSAVFRKLPHIIISHH